MGPPLHDPPSVIDRSLTHCPNSWDHLFWTDDTLNGGAGNDRLEGSGGGDTYQFGIGSGQDVIYDYIEYVTWDGIDSVEFLGALNQADVTFDDSVDGNDLIITINGYTDTLTIEDQFASRDYTWIESFILNDVTLSAGYIYTIVKGGGIIEGTPGADDLDGDDGNNQIYGLGGNDDLYGDDGDDLLDGGDGDDYIYGFEGQDQYIASNGNDTIKEFNGNSIIENDEILFGPGITLADLDIYRTEASEWYLPDHLVIEWEDNGNNNKITIEEHFNTNRDDAVELIRFDDNSTYNLVTNDFVFKGTAAGETLEGFSSTANRFDINDTLLGFGGDDTLDGGNGNDILDGGDGNDQLEGGNDNDTYIASNGLDHIHESAGVDEIVFGDNILLADLTLYRASGDDLVIEWGSGNVITIEDQFYQFSNDEEVEQLRFYDGSTYSLLGQSYTYKGTSGDDTLNGNGSASYGDDDEIYGFDGNDDIDARDGNDTVYGGAGNDDIFGDSGQDLIYGEDGDDILDGDDDNDEIHGGDGIDDILGGGGADILYGDFGADTIDGEGGNDSIYGGEGADTIDGGSGDDFIDGGTEDDIIDAGNGTDTIYGRAGNDTIIGDDGNDIIDGGSGDDLLEGGNDDDIIDGGDGTDTVTYENAALSVTLDLSTGVVSSDGYGDADTLANIENVIGSDQDDTLTGNTDSNIFEGGLGNDALNAGDGSDEYVFSVGDGQDTITDTDGTDDFIRMGAGIAQADVILTQVGNNLEITFTSGTDKITVIDHYDAGTTKQVEKIVFDDLSEMSLVGPNVVDGTSGADTIYGTVDNDLINGYEGNDYIYGEGGDDEIHGGAGNDWIYTGSGNDIIYGDDGNDRIYDGGGQDTYNGGAGSVDRVSYESAVSGIIVDMSAGTVDEDGDGNAEDTLVNITHITGSAYADEFYGSSAADDFIGVDGDDLVYGGAGNDQLRGNGGDDTIYGEDGNDAIYGHEGNNLLYGGNGNDNFYVDQGNNTIDGGAGTDIIRYNFGNVAITLDMTAGTVDKGQDSIIDDTFTSIESAYGSKQDDLMIGDSAANMLQGQNGNDTIYGGDGNDTIYGNNNNDVLYGENGNDYLFGGSGNDFIYGGAGSDTLRGQAGADTFVYQSGDIDGSNDTFYDFSLAESDAIDISDVLVGYDPLTDAITDFVHITSDGTHSYLRIDTDGGADNFIQIAQISNVTGLGDEEALETAGTLITV